MTARQSAIGSGGDISCWCCGQRRAAESVVHLGNHPEVVVCLRCAHFLHKQARGREDALRSSPTARVRDALRAVRWQVVRRGWHRKPGIGPLLRRLGKHTP
jgi:hypothetical protein